MSTEIQWTDETWNPVRGCAKVSEGCRNCYAMKQAHRFSGAGQPYEGLTKLVKGKGPQWSGVVRTVPDMLDRPLRWRKPRRVFVNSMSDLFHEDVPFEFIAAVFGVMWFAHRHTFQILTKRPERAVEFFGWLGKMVGRNTLTGELSTLDCDPLMGCRIQAGRRVTFPTFDPREVPSRWPLPNVWIGTSVEDQAAADERIPHLLRVPAAVRFLSCEPLLGPVDLIGKDPQGSALHEHFDDPRVEWVIIGGESGPGARPFEVEWAESLVRQCQDAGVAAFVKQLGADPHQRVQRPLRDGYGGDHAPGWRSTLEPLAFRDSKGGDITEWPEQLRVREFPETAGATS